MKQSLLILFPLLLLFISPAHAGGGEFACSASRDFEVYLSVIMKGTEGEDCVANGLMQKFSQMYETHCPEAQVEAACQRTRVQVPGGKTKNLGSREAAQQAYNAVDSARGKVTAARDKCAHTIKSAIHSCMKAFNQLPHLVQKCSPEQVEVVKQGIVKRTQNGVKIYCKSVKNQISGRATQVRLENRKRKIKVILDRLSSVGSR